MLSIDEIVQGRMAAYPFTIEIVKDDGARYPKGTRFTIVGPSSVQTMGGYKHHGQYYFTDGSVEKWGGWKGYSLISKYPVNGINAHTAIDYGVGLLDEIVYGESPPLNSQPSVPECKCISLINGHLNGCPYYKG